jgi:hypothetical protein
MTIEAGRIVDAIIPIPVTADPASRPLSEPACDIITIPTAVDTAPTAITICAGTRSSSHPTSRPNTPAVIAWTPGTSPTCRRLRWNCLSTEGRKIGKQL